MINEKLIRDLELDPRWIQENGFWKFNFDYPQFREDAYYSSEKSFYKLSDILDCFRTCNAEFNLMTDFTASSQISAPILSKMVTLPPKAHIIQDFEVINLYYRQLVYEANIAEEYEQLYEQKTSENQQKENETMVRLIQAYLYAPVERDEHFRKINREVFNDRDDDPMLLYEFKGDTTLSTGFLGELQTERDKKFPRLKVFSKNTLDDREYRRSMLLSTSIKGFTEIERRSAVYQELKFPRSQSK